MKTTLSSLLLTVTAVANAANCDVDTLREIANTNDAKLCTSENTFMVPVESTEGTTPVNKSICAGEACERVLKALDEINEGTIDGTALHKGILNPIMRGGSTRALRAADGSHSHSHNSTEATAASISSEMEGSHGSTSGSAEMEHSRDMTSASTEMEDSHDMVSSGSAATRGSDDVDDSDGDGDSHDATASSTVSSSTKSTSKTDNSTSGTLASSKASSSNSMTTTQAPSTSSAGSISISISISCTFLAATAAIFF